MATDTEEESDDYQQAPSIVVNGTNDMICAKCFNNSEEESGAVGICKDCKFYLCGDCCKSHLKENDYKKHKIAFFYCAQKLKINKLAPANCFCLDCGQYLCKKCKLDHSGFRMYRNHTFIGGRNGQLPDDIFEEKDTRQKRRSHSHFKRSEESPVKQAPRPSLTRSKTMDATVGRRLGSRSSRRSQASSVPETTKRRKQTVTVDEEALKPRTLIQSTTGRKPAKGKAAKSAHTPNKVKRPNAVQFHEPVETANLIGEHEARSPLDERKCHIVASVFLSNGNLVVADHGNQNLKLFDDNFKFVSHIELENLPVAICASNMNASELYASSGSKVLRLAADKGFQIRSTFETDIDKIQGLTNWASGIAVVFRSTRSKSDRKGHLEVHLLDLNGTVKYEITISSPLVTKLTTPIWYICSTNDGDAILVSDTYNNRIICVDIVSWHVIYVIRGRDTDGVPTSLGVDNDGNFLVTWYNEVHKISPTGIDLGVPVPRIGKQSVIAYNPKTNCLVVHPDKKTQSDKFQIYQMS